MYNRAVRGGLGVAISISPVSFHDAATAAVRQELREMLHELSESLLKDAQPVILLNAVHHAWALVDLAVLGDGRLARLLRNLNRDLRNAKPLDVAYYVKHLGDLAAQLAT